MFNHRFKTLTAYVTAFQVLCIGCVPTFSPDESDATPATPVAVAKAPMVTAFDRLKQLADECAKENQSQPVPDNGPIKLKPPESYDQFLAAFRNRYGKSFGEWQSAMSAAIAKYEQDIPEAAPKVPEFRVLRQRLDDISSGAHKSDQKEAAKKAETELTKYTGLLEKFVADLQNHKSMLLDGEIVATDTKSQYVGLKSRFQTVVDRVTELSKLDTKSDPGKVRIAELLAKPASHIEDPCNPKDQNSAVTTTSGESTAVAGESPAVPGKNAAVPADSIYIALKEFDCGHERVIESEKGLAVSMEAAIAQYKVFLLTLEELRSLVNVPIPDPAKENDSFWEQVGPLLLIPGLGPLIALACLIFGCGGSGDGSEGGATATTDNPGNTVQDSDGQEEKPPGTPLPLAFPEEGEHEIYAYHDGTNGWLAVRVHKQRANELRLPFSIERYTGFEDLASGLKEKKLSVVSLTVFSWYPITLEVNLPSKPGVRYLIQWTAGEVDPVLLISGGDPPFKLNESEKPLPTLVSCSPGKWQIQLVGNGSQKSYKFHHSETNEEISLPFEPNKLNVATDGTEQTFELADFGFGPNGQRFPVILKIKHHLKDGTVNRIDLEWKSEADVAVLNGTR